MNHNVYQTHSTICKLVFFEPFYLISSSTDKKIRVWKLDGEQLYPLTSWSGLSSSPTKFYMDHKSKLYTFDNNFIKQPSIRSWNIETLERDRIFPMYSKVNYNDIDISIVNNETVLYSTELYGRFSLWDADNARVLSTHSIDHSIFSVITFNSNLFFLLTDIGVLLWDNRNLSNPVYNFLGHQDSLVLGAKKIDDNNLLSYSNGKVVLWNINGDVHGQINVNYQITSIEKSDYLWVKNPDFIDSFSLNGEHRGTIIDNNGPIRIYSPFKNYLLTSSSRCLNVWDAYGQEITTRQGHQNQINTICSYQDWIFTGSSDGCIRQWHMV